MAKTKGKTGRPKIEIDYELVDELAGIFCNADEIAACLRVGYSTVERRIKEDHNMAFEDYIALKRNELAKPSLRRMQYKNADEGNATMQIFLGKQYLGQADKIESKEEHTKIKRVNYRRIKTEIALD